MRSLVLGQLACHHFPHSLVKVIDVNRLFLRQLGEVLLKDIVNKPDRCCFRIRQECSTLHLNHSCSIMQVDPHPTQAQLVLAKAEVYHSILLGLGSIEVAYNILTLDSDATEY